MKMNAQEVEEVYEHIDYYRDFDNDLIDFDDDDDDDDDDDLINHPHNYQS